MTRPCACGGAAASTCNCVIQAGANTGVSGIGTPEDPYILTAGTAQLNAVDTNSIDMTVAGAGTVGSPYQVSGAVRRSTTAGNLLTETASGLLVACGQVQDCVAQAMGPGLAWNPTDRLYQARLSTLPGNNLLIANDGGLYVSNDGTIQPPQNRARVIRSTAQAIPSGSGVTTLVSFDTELIDKGNLFNPAQPTRLTAQVAAGYTIGACVAWASAGVNLNAGDRMIFLRKNGVDTLVYDRVDAATSVSTSQSVTTCVDMAVGDYIELVVRHTQGASLNVLSDSPASPAMFMFLTTEGI